MNETIGVFAGIVETNYICTRVSVTLTKKELTVFKVGWVLPGYLECKPNLNDQKNVVDVKVIGFKQRRARTPPSLVSTARDLSHAGQMMPELGRRKVLLNAKKSQGGNVGTRTPFCMTLRLHTSKNGSEERVQGTQQHHHNNLGSGGCTQLTTKGKFGFFCTDLHGCFLCTDVLKDPASAGYPVPGYPGGYNVEYKGLGISSGLLLLVIRCAVLPKAKKLTQMQLLESRFTRSNTKCAHV